MWWRAGRNHAPCPTTFLAGRGWFPMVTTRPEPRRSSRASFNFSAFFLYPQLVQYEMCTTGNEVRTAACVWFGWEHRCHPANTPHPYQLHRTSDSCRCPSRPPAVQESHPRLLPALPGTELGPREQANSVIGATPWRQTINPDHTKWQAVGVRHEGRVWSTVRPHGGNARMGIAWNENS